MDARQTEQERIKSQLYDMQSSLLQLQAKIGESRDEQRSAYQQQAKALYDEYSTLREALEDLHGVTTPTEYNNIGDPHIRTLMNELSDSFSTLMKYMM